MNKEITKNTEETYQGVAVEEKLHLPVAGHILHLLQTIANGDIVVDQIEADVGSQKVRKGYPIRLLASPSWANGGNLIWQTRTRSRRSKLVRWPWYIS